MNNIINKAKLMAYKESELTYNPIKEHIDFLLDIGVKLAEKLNANIEIVELGILLMDLKIGKALKLGKVEEHIKMSVNESSKLLNKSSLSDIDKKNVIKCIEEHHGSNKFYSLESEICCNTDCYKFISIKGFTIALRSLHGFELNDLTKLLDSKAEEKWNALSLDTCKKELEPQYKLIKEYLSYLKIING